MAESALWVRQRPVVAFGPEMPGWGSWEWVGADLLTVLRESYRGLPYRAGMMPDADVIFVIKHAPSPGWVERAARRAAVIYCPVDFYSSASQIAADGQMLRKCARVIVHCERLRRYFQPYAPVEYLDHHVKFAVPGGRAWRSSGYMLWVGVRTNLPPLVEWVNRHPLPAELVVLTNPEQPGLVPTARELGFRPDRAIRIREWSRDAHLQAIAEARAALDIKGDDFRSRHKPPAKAIDFLASGVPLAMNPDSSATEHLARMGFEITSPLEPERWLSRNYAEETRRFGAALRELLSRERIGRRFRRIIDEVLL